MPLSQTVTAALLLKQTVHTRGKLCLLNRIATYRRILFVQSGRSAC